ncbi:hypothetical protein T492DRAFT_886166, partial [Pavlovales sp. CCMP2436]
MRHAAAGLVFFVGAHTPAADLLGLRAMPALAATKELTPLEEAWDYADRYFLDRTFGGNDWKEIRVRLVE